MPSSGPLVEAAGMNSAEESAEHDDKTVNTCSEICLLIQILFYVEKNLISVYSFDMPKRNEIITTIGVDKLTSNTEADEFSYKIAFGQAHKDFSVISGNFQFRDRRFTNLDLRFEGEGLSVLVETKKNYDKENSDELNAQLTAYAEYEKKLTGNKIIVVLANTDDPRVITWIYDSIEGNSRLIERGGVLSDRKLLSEDRIITFQEYHDLAFPPARNSREEVMRNTYQLNEMLHKYGVGERLRSQFVGSCLLALKAGMRFQGLTSQMVIAGIRKILEDMLSKNLNKAEKITILARKVLEQQDIKNLPDDEMQDILRFINDNILVYINDRTVMGQDLLNLFFTTFNKYVGKADKNQAFSPDHIVDFMCKIIGISKNSRVLDPCCGSGSFLVKALTDALDDCDTKDERSEVKEQHIYGIEFEETAFGLSTTNMLIHGDGNSNIYNASCFEMGTEIEKWNIDRVLMNPPYNAQRKHCNPDYVKTWKNDTKEDPSKGFHFVYEIARHVKSGKLAVLLPMQCAIGNSKEIQKFKELMLQEHHLDAVFSLPPDIFHPGASASACCMVFDLGIRHDKAPIKETFFGYFKDDGFTKKKNLGRVEKVDPKTKNGMWKGIESKWLDAYFHRKNIPGLSVTKIVTAEDEWLAEAYMETDYTTLTEIDFQQTVNDYLSYLVKTGRLHEN